MEKSRGKQKNKEENKEVVNFFIQKKIQKKVETYLPTEIGNIIYGIYTSGFCFLERLPDSEEKDLF